MREGSGVRGLPRNRRTHTEPPLPPSPLRERVGVRVAAGPSNLATSPATHTGKVSSYPSPGGEGYGVRGLPVEAPQTTTVPWALAWSMAPPFFPLAKGRGRACPELAEGFGRLRPKPVRGLPGEPTLGYAKVSQPGRPLQNPGAVRSAAERLFLPLPVGEGWGEGLPVVDCRTPKRPFFVPNERARRP